MSDIDGFKSFLVSNKDKSKTECIANAVANYGIRRVVAEGLIETWIHEGILEATREEPTGPGRPRLIITGPK